MALKKCKECGKEVSTKADSCPNCGAKLKQHIGCLQSIFYIFLALMFIGYLASKEDYSSPSSSYTKSSYSKPDTKKAIMSLLSLDFSWGKKGFDNIMSANFTIKNMSDSDIKDIEITCSHYSNSNTKIDSNTRTIYEVFKKHSTRTINDFDMGFIHSQANSSSCEVSDFTIN